MINTLKMMEHCVDFSGKKKKKTLSRSHLVRILQYVDPTISSQNAWRYLRTSLLAHSPDIKCVDDVYQVPV